MQLFHLNVIGLKNKNKKKLDRHIKINLNLSESPMRCCQDGLRQNTCEKSTVCLGDMKCLHLHNKPIRGSSPDFISPPTFALETASEAIICKVINICGRRERNDYHYFCRLSNESTCWHRAEKQFSTWGDMAYVNTHKMLNQWKVCCALGSCSRGIMQHPAIRRNTKPATQRLLAKLKERFSMNKSEVVQWKAKNKNKTQNIPLNLNDWAARDLKLLLKARHSKSDSRCWVYCSCDSEQKQKRKRWGGGGRLCFAPCSAEPTSRKTLYTVFLLSSPPLPTSKACAEIEKDGYRSNFRWIGNW